MVVAALALLHREGWHERQVLGEGLLFEPAHMTDVLVICA